MSQGPKACAADCLFRGMNKISVWDEASQYHYFPSIDMIYITTQKLQILPYTVLKSNTSCLTFLIMPTSAVSSKLAIRFVCVHDI